MLVVMGMPSGVDVLKGSVQELISDQSLVVPVEEILRCLYKVLAMLDKV